MTTGEDLFRAVLAAPLTVCRHCDKLIRSVGDNDYVHKTSGVRSCGGSFTDGSMAWPQCAIRAG